jgi:prepilin-type N-terminal cleavage/methylation domain-containing protein
MQWREDKGFTLIELLVVLFIASAVALFAWDAMSGWRERNALRLVSRDVKYILEKYRQKAMDKGYNYGLIFSDDGIYAFEDNGGSGSQPFMTMNNFAVDAGEFSDQYRGDASGNRRNWRRVSRATSEFKFFAGPNASGRILVMTTNSLDLSGSRSGNAYTTIGTDISSQAIQPFSGGDNAPFTGGLALFFSPDGCAYIKSPTVSIAPIDRYVYQLGNGIDSFYIVRIAYDDVNTSRADVPTYFEIAINKYGASTYIRWQSNDGGASWNADVQ